MAESIYDVSVRDVLEAMGCKETSKNMFLSPFRKESKGSLHVNPTKNIWYDHGLGDGGNVVKLVMMAKQCSLSEAVKYLHEKGKTMPSVARNVVKEEKSTIEIKSVKEIHSYYISKYLESRHIPLHTAMPYCKEVVVHSNAKDRDFLLLGFENNTGNYALCSPSGFKMSSGAGITTINQSGERSVFASTDRVAVFEGFFDFLSWQVLQSTKSPNCDVVVLNSVNNIQKASAYLQSHKSILAFLDNDEAGRRCLAAIRSMNPGIEVKDMSALYKNHKDLNEMLVASRGYSFDKSIEKNV